MTVSVEEGLYNAVKSLASNRVYPRLPQPATFPLIRYQRIYTSRRESVDGQNVGITEVGMQVDCMAETYAAAKALADSVRGVLHLYRGQWGASTSPETHLIARNVVLETENDMSEIDGDDRTYWVIQRYKIWTNMT